ncbi:pentapeptide repeats family protein [Mycobacterium kansasii 662]|uniref:Pentapeptide repeats family protein n=1 Tax=Mycobacterium kansasii 662 TaxID=1299326 RepID=X7XQD2_MYCKA|nr:hypothetical protein [Mycobacterium kansasii]ETZ96379.1 pentapeptide repeats family protein [Mycobacterium kansasii 662]
MTSVLADRNNKFGFGGLNSGSGNIGFGNSGTGNVGFFNSGNETWESATQACSITGLGTRETSTPASATSAA